MNITQARVIAGKHNAQIDEGQCERTAFHDIWNTTYLQAILVVLLRIDEALRAK